MYSKGYFHILVAESRGIQALSFCVKLIKK